MLKLHFLLFSLVTIFFQIYDKDNFGLRTLDLNGGVHTYTFTGIEHTHWHGAKEVFDKAIEPWLT